MVGSLSFPTRDRGAGRPQQPKPPAPPHTPPRVPAPAGRANHGGRSGASPQPGRRAPIGIGRGMGFHGGGLETSFFDVRRHALAQQRWRSNDQSHARLLLSAVGCWISAELLLRGRKPLDSAGTMALLPAADPRRVHAVGIMQEKRACESMLGSSCSCWALCVTQVVVCDPRWWSWTKQPAPTGAPRLPPPLLSPAAQRWRSSSSAA
jgi:hypothetical protein